MVYSFQAAFVSMLASSSKFGNDLATQRALIFFGVDTLLPLWFVYHFVRRYISKNDWQILR